VYINGAQKISQEWPADPASNVRLVGFSKTPDSETWVGRGYMDELRAWSGYAASSSEVYSAALGTNLASPTCWYPFNNWVTNIEDSASNNFGPFAPGYYCVWETGQCYSINSSAGSYIRYTRSWTELTNQITVSMWVYPSNALYGNAQVAFDLIATPTAAGTQKCEIVLGGNQDADPYTFRGRMGFQTGSPQLRAQTASNVWTSAVNSNWQHVAVSYDFTAPISNRVCIYLNGALQPIVKDDGVTGDLTGISDLFLGTDGDGGTPWSVNIFPGKIDDVRIYNTILSSAYIAQILYNAGNGRR
jgi:hypothetical protein